MNKAIYVTKAAMPSYEEYTEAIKCLWDTHMLTNMGFHHKELENQLKQYLKVPGILLFSSGHMALELALQAMNLSGEVITTPFTFASTTHAIVRNRLKPVFCDINPQDYTMDVSKLEALITNRTTAIVPVHVYGNVCNVKEIKSLADKYDLKVIYDAAHAFGVTVDGEGIGNFGDASVFSFHATKTFHTIEGGAAAISDLALGYRLYQLKNFGFMNEETVEEIGTNAKMNEFQAIMGLCNLKHYEEGCRKRKRLVERYRKRLGGIDGIKILEEQEGVESNYSYFPVVFEEKLFGYSRNEVMKWLNRENIFPRKYFYPLTSSFGCYQGQYDVSRTPVALHMAKRVLTLPLYADLTPEEVDFICDVVLSGRTASWNQEPVCQIMY